MTEANPKEVHLGIWPRDYEGVLTTVLDAGYRIVQEGETPRGPVAFLNTDDDQPGTSIELAATTDARVSPFAAVEAAVHDWDGTDPVRTDWPT